MLLLFAPLQIATRKREVNYSHGVRSEKLYHEKTQLDRAIDRYQEIAAEYHDKLNELENAPADIREKRKQKVAEIKSKLETQRMTMESMAIVQAGLEQYRSAGREVLTGTRQERQNKLNVMQAEGHHKKDLEVLEAFMRAVGKPKPGSRHTAHHLVPGKGKTRYAGLARTRMHRFGVRINDPDNGVWLPMHKADTPLWSMPASKGHLEYHTNGYEAWIEERLKTRTGEAFIRIELNLIEKMLQANKLPERARKKK